MRPENNNCSNWENLGSFNGFFSLVFKSTFLTALKTGVAPEGQWGSLGLLVRTTTSLLCSGAGGLTDCSTLHGNQKEKPSVLNWIYSKSPYSAETTTILGRENGQEKKKRKKKNPLCCALNFLTLAKKVRKFCDYLPGVHTSLCTHMKIWQLWNVKKYVFLVRCESSFWEDDVGQRRLRLSDG